MSIFFSSIDNLLLLLPLQAIQWKSSKKESIDSKILFYTICISSSRVASCYF